MIRVKVISNTIAGREESPWVEIADGAGRKIADLATERISGAVLNGATVYKRGDAGWNRRLRSGDELALIITDADPFSIGAAIAASASLIAAVGTTGAAVLGVLAGIGIAAGEIGASMLLSSLLAPSAPKLGASSSRSSSPTYGFDSIQNGFNVGGPIQVTYGKMITGGQVIAAWREPDNNGNDVLRYIISLGEGPIYRIGQYTSDQNDLAVADAPDDMTINGLALSKNTKLKGIKISLRLGSNTQGHMYGFQDLVTEYGQPGNTKLTSGHKVIWIAKDYATGFSAVMSFTKGLYQIDSKGRAKHLDVSVRMKVIRVSDSVTVVDHTATFSKNRQSAYSVQIKVTGQPIDLYRIEVTRTTGDYQSTTTKPKVADLYLTSINEIQAQTNFTYPNTALVGVTIQATDQMSGGFPRTLIRCDGRIIDVPNDDTLAAFTPAWTRNPAWAALDMATHPRYGGGNFNDYGDMDGPALFALAAQADEQIPPFTGADPILNPDEARYEFDAIFDTERGWWAALTSILSTCRAIPLKRGNLITVKMEKDAAASQLFQLSNVHQGTFQDTYSSARNRFNSITGRVIDRYNNYTTLDLTAQDRRITTDGLAINPTSVDLFGITRPSQGKRALSFFLRWEQLAHDGGSFETGVAGLATEPLDIIIISDTIGESGLLKAVDGSGHTVLARPYAFIANRLYTYFEQSSVDESFLSQSFSVGSDTTTDTLPFAPLGGGTGAFGRKYTIGRRGNETRKAIILQQDQDNGDKSRRITWIKWDADLYSDATTEDIGTALFVPTLSNVVVDVTGIAVVETSTEDGVSTLAITWTGTAGDTGYNVFTRIDGAQWESAGDTTTAALTIESDALQGTPIDIGVQTMNADGQTNDPFPYILYVIRREDGAQTIVVFPAQVTGLTLTPGSGNASTLTWAAVTLDTNGNALTPTGYEVRLGTWAGGIVLYKSTARTLALKLPNVARRYHIRAYKTQDAKDWYSPADAYIDAAAVALGSYATPASGSPFDTIGGKLGTAANGAAILWDSEYNFPLFQLNNAAPFEWLTNTVTIGGSAVPVRVGMDLRVLPVLEDSGNDLFMSMQQYSVSGEIRRRYVSYAAILEYSANSNFSPLGKADLAALANTDLIVTARYLRVRFTGQATTPFSLDSPPDNDRYASVLLGSLILSFDTA